MNSGEAKTVWGYEAVLMIDGEPSGRVIPPAPRGALWGSREEIYESPRSRAGTLRIKRVRAVVLADGSLTYA